MLRAALRYSHNDVDRRVVLPILAGSDPTEAVRSSSQRLPHPSQFALPCPTSSPQGYLASLPARAAYSHSASLGRRNRLPVISDSQPAYACASSQVTSITVRTGASSTSPPPDRSPIRKVPAGTTTSSGHASQSRTTWRRARPQVLLDPRGVWRRWSRQWRPPTVPSNPRFRTARHLLCASVVGKLMRRSCSNQSACGPSDRHLFRPDPWRGFESAESLPETCAARGGLSMTGKRSSVPVLEEVRLTVRSQHSSRLS